MNISKMNQRAAALGGDVLWIPLKDGVTTVRVVARVGDEEPWREVDRHFLQNYVRVDDFPKAPVCLDDDSCPGCRISAQLRADGDDQNANRTKAQHRFIWVAISRDNPFDDDGGLRLKMLESPITVFQGMARTAKEWGMDFTDAQDGYDLEILRTSTGPMPKYEVKAVTSQEGATKTVLKSPLTEAETALVLEAYPDIDELLRPPEYRRFAQAVGFPVEEPDVNPPGGAVPGTPPPQSVAQPATTESDPQPEQESQCPYFGTAYDTADDACKRCGKAADCKTQTEGASEPEAPKRTPV